MPTSPRVVFDDRDLPGFVECHRPEQIVRQLLIGVVGIGLYHPSGASQDPLDGPMLDWRIEKNHVYDNNLPNSVVGGLVENLPTGGGILILGVDGVTVKRNLIENNDFYGVALVNWCLANGGTPFNCADNPPAANPSGEPHDVRIEDNTLINNGTAPPAHPFDPLAADIINAAILPPALNGNCFEGNEYTTYASVAGGNPDPAGPPQCN